MPPVSILERPGTAERLWPLSVEAYHVLGEAGVIPEKTELLYGFVFNKMSKSPLHSFLTCRLIRWIQEAAGQGWLVRSEQPVVCGDSEPEPDVSVVRGTEKDFRKQHPISAEWVIEVAVSSEDYDRDKIPAYAYAGVKEFWIVLAAEQRIEIYRDPKGRSYRTKQVLSGDEKVIPLAFSGLALTPAKLFAE